MKRFQTLMILILVLCFLSSCGGGTDSEEQGDSLGPIVNEDTDFNESDKTTVVAGGMICPWDEREFISLEIERVENHHGISGDEQSYIFPLNFYTGFEHRYGFPEPEELQTRVHFSIYLSGQKLSVEDVEVLDLRISFAFFADIIWSRESGEPLELIEVFDEENGLEILDFNNIRKPIARHLDDFHPGFFDIKSEGSDRDMNDQLIAAQVCEAKVKIDGIVYESIGSQQIIFTPRLGKGPQPFSDLGGNAEK